LEICDEQLFLIRGIFSGKNHFWMKKLILIFTILIIGLSMISSFVGVLNYQTLNFESFVTESGEQVEILTEELN